MGARLGTVSVLLTFAAGTDLACFLQLDLIFASVMTGNMVLLGLAAGTSDGAAAWNTGIALLGYVVGTMVGVLVTRLVPRRRFTAGLVVEALPLAAFWAVWAAGHGCGDFLTCVQHDLPVKIVVVKNNTLGLIKWEQMVFLGNPEYGVNMAPLDFVKFAEAAGARGWHVEKREEMGNALRAAMEYDGPAIVEVVTDEHEPPMPAKVKPQQVKKMAAALKEGTPNRNRIALQMVKDVLDESSFDASPGGFIPSSIGHAAAKVAEAARNRTQQEHE